MHVESTELSALGGGWMVEVEGGGVLQYLGDWICGGGVVEAMEAMEARRMNEWCLAWLASRVGLDLRGSEVV